MIQFLVDQGLNDARSFACVTFVKLFCVKDIYASVCTKDDCGGKNIDVTFDLPNVSDHYRAFTTKKSLEP